MQPSREPTLLDQLQDASVVQAIRDTPVIADALEMPMSELIANTRLRGLLKTIANIEVGQSSSVMSNEDQTDMQSKKFR